VTDRERDRFWLELSSLGENTVRERLADGVYGDRKRRLVEAWLRDQQAQTEEARSDADRLHRQREVAVAASGTRASWLSSIFSGAALLVSLGALIVSWTALAQSRREVLNVILDPHLSDYGSRLSAFPAPGFAGLLDGFWDYTLINNGDRTISVLSLDLKKLDARGVVMYSGMNGGVLDMSLKAVALPMSIEPGQSRRLVLKIRAPIDSLAFSYQIHAFPDSTIPSIVAAANILADKGLDFFGNRTRGIRADGRIVGFEVQELTREPSFGVTVETGRGTRVSAVAGWYPSRSR